MHPPQLMSISELLQPAGMMMRLMKATRRVRWWCCYLLHDLTASQLNICLDLLRLMREDAEKMAAGDLHELMRAWENYHRIWCVETQIRHIEFRKESRYYRILLSAPIIRALTKRTGSDYR
jgi:adenylylsulfate reductase subunit A